MTPANVVRDEPIFLRKKIEDLREAGASKSIRRALPITRLNNVGLI